jgi:uroporphyrinogen-III synthase
MGGADLVASASTQEGMLDALPRPAGRVLFAGAERARPLLRDRLNADFIALYRTHELRPARFPDADLVVLASASAARAYGALGIRTPAVSIGPQTTAAAREAGVEVVAEAETHDLDGLVDAVRRMPPWSSPS